MKKNKSPRHIAVVGATGVVGREVLSILAERHFPIASIKALASENSKGQTIEFGDDQIQVEALTADAFKGVEIAFFAVENKIAQEFCPIAVKHGAVCIDKSSAHREINDVPLVVPEVNPEAIAGYKRRGIIASPNCTATPLVQVLAPLAKKSPIKRVVMCSYQAVSGAGQNGIDELERQVRDLFNAREAETKVFGQPIAFNVVPYIRDEEQKVIDESRKILGLPNLKMGVTCVRVPVFNGHSEAVHIEFENAITPDEVRDILGKTPGLLVLDDASANLFPTPLQATGQDVTLVGRIRKDESVNHGIALWLSSDNLRTGAALNAVRIAGILSAEYLGS